MTSAATIQRVAHALRAQIRPALEDALAAADALDQLARAPRAHKQRLSDRDTVIRAIAKRFFDGQKIGPTAGGIARGLSSYRSRAWQRLECDFRENPNPTKIEGYFWEVLRLIDEPIGDRQINRILKKNSVF